jgi:hypothetical protein
VPDLSEARAGRKKARRPGRGRAMHPRDNKRVGPGFATGPTARRSSAMTSARHAQGATFENADRRMRRPCRRCGRSAHLLGCRWP